MEECGVCGIRNNFYSILNLPNLPLTESFGEYDKDFPNFDQELIICGNCGHTQLKNQFDNDFLYEPDRYAFRSGDGLKSDNEISYLMQFANDVLKGQNINHVLEIGANDLKLSKILTNIFDSVSACDPLLIEEHGNFIDKIQIIGLPIEKAVNESEFIKPDLVISRHTLEHISNPKIMLETLLNFVNDHCIFIFEVPSLMHIAEALRFDAIFHQHYHYFDLASIENMVTQLDLKVVNFTYNNQGSNGGSLLFALRKIDNQDNKSFKVDKNKSNKLKNRIDIFFNQMNLIKTTLDEIPAPIYGFGAALMLSTFDYHLDGRLQKVKYILDDDPQKHGIGYKNLNVDVVSTQNFTPLEQSSFIITSLENIRPIYNRITQFNPRRIIAPFIS